MKYLCLVYLEGRKLHAVPDRECKNCGDGFRERGLLLAAEALQPVDTATTVRVRNGKLTVTNRRLLYRATDDASLTGVLNNRAARGFLEIGKDEIVGLEVQRKLFSKRAILTLADDSVHTFDYGAMNIDKCVAAIEAR